MISLLTTCFLMACPVDAHAIVTTNPVRATRRFIERATTTRTPPEASACYVDGVFHRECPREPWQN